MILEIYLQFGHIAFATFVCNVNQLTSVCGCYRKLFAWLLLPAGREHAAAAPVHGGSLLSGAVIRAAPLSERLLPGRGRPLGLQALPAGLLL